MPNVISALGLVKDGEKSVLLNLSNARTVDYDTLEEMTEAQKQGVIICPDYPLDEGNMIPASAISYGNGSAEDALDKSQAMIATVQPNLTAVKAYAVGEQFVYQGLLYKATAAISSGGTITIGGNCELSPKVTEQIRSLVDKNTWKAINVPTPTTSGNTRTYTVDLSNYSEVRVALKINSYGNVGTFTMSIGDSLYINYTDDSNYVWMASVVVTSTAIIVKTFSHSTTPATYYFLLQTPNFSAR